MAMVCLCHGVTERAVRKAIERGAGSVGEVGERCAAGTCCGGCLPTIEAMLARADAAASPVRLVFATGG